MTTSILAPDFVLHGHQWPVRLIRFGLAGLMASADTDMQLVVWRGSEPIRELDLRSESPRHRPHDRLRDCVFAINGQSMFVCAGTRLLEIDLATAEQVWKYHAPEFWPFMLTAPQCLVLDHDGALVCTFDNGSFEIRDANRSLKYRKSNRESPQWFNLDKTSRRLIGCDGYSLTVWNLDTGERLQRQPLVDHAFAFAYSPERGVAAVRDAGTIRLWKVFEGNWGEELKVRPCPPLIAFDNPGKQFAYANGADIQIRNFESTHESRISCPESRFVSIAFDNAGNLWSGHGDGTIRKWPNLENRD